MYAVTPPTCYGTKQLKNVAADDAYYARRMEPAEDGQMRGARTVRWILPLLMLALALAATIAPTGQAQSAAESSPAAQTLIAEQRAAARAERAAAAQARREARAAERAPNAQQLRALSNERTNGVVTITCTSVTWTFREFPALAANTVTEKLKVNRVKSTSTFTFDGSSGTDTMPINAPPGSYIIDTGAKWRRNTANGASGSFDIHAKVTCAPRPDMGVEKLQRIEGGDPTYITSTQTAEVGQTVGYEIMVRNPGNVPMTVGGLTDPRCDAATLTGGPAGGVLAPGATSAYTCTHTLDAADLAVGSYSNTVMLTGTPPPGDGSPKTKTSNTVVTEVKPASTPPTEEKKTTPPPSAAPGAPATPSGSDAGKAGVLAFSTGTVPILTGPPGCVRAKFHASVKSAGVARVTFYLDGRRLRKMTAHSARGGLLSVTGDASRLRAGRHRLLAKITLVKASAGANAVEASRSVTIRRCRPHA